MDDSDNHLWNMYGGGSVTPKPSAPVPDRFKQASRVIGGMKAQGSHTVTVEIDGVFQTLPKHEYVAQLETQLREARQHIKDLQTKISRQARVNNKVMEKLRQLETDLTNKIDIRHP